MKSYHGCKCNELKKKHLENWTINENTFQTSPWEMSTAANWHRNKKIKSERLRNVVVVVNRGPFRFLSSQNIRNVVIIMNPIMQESKLLQLLWDIAGVAEESIEGVQQLTTKI